LAAEPPSPGIISSSPAGFAQTRLASRWKRFNGGHPAPNDESLAAAGAAFGLLARANEDSALVIFLISGGGSAMIESPINDDISITDLHSANKLLVDCGASIAEINSVRRSFSAVKGGKLAARAPNCEQISLIVSDVPPGQDWNVASGPTVSPSPDAPNAQDVISQYKLTAKLPASILHALKNPERSIQTHPKTSKHFVLLDNESALRKAADAARQRGFITEIASEIADQSIEEGCLLLIERLKTLREKYRGDNKSLCLISGGEFTCPVNGNGIGGRNLETALRLAALSPFNQTDFAALCAGTDGIDGNSPAAGAIVDNTTRARAQAIGLDAQNFLRRSDSYSFFVALGDVVATGATGTNVRDLRILLDGS
jgi:hydroxypyruvate reductase